MKEMTKCYLIKEKDFPVLELWGLPIYLKKKVMGDYLEVTIHCLERDVKAIENAFAPIV